ncbi:MAG: hypothetical protein HPY45_16565 [Anaerolineae bacterium]|nr:hypothetical protein [Anaerolineae bacterium]
MTKTYIFLNYPLSPDDPNPPAIPKPEFTPFLSLKAGNEANVTTIKLVSHTGTHVDAPCHVIENGITITDFKAEEFLFHRPLVFDLLLPDETIVLPEHLMPLLERDTQADILLFRFDYGVVRRSDPLRFSLRSPGFGVESVKWLLDHFPCLRAVGMDVPSLACIVALDKTMAAHNVLLAGNGGRFLVIEDMNLDQDLTGLSQVIVAPWMIRDLDGSPATIFGVLET